MILYTSGTTGKPKGAVITNKMLFWNSINTGLRLNLTQNDVTITFAPFFHTGGWNVLTTPMMHRGATVLLMKKFDADKILQLCDEEQVTILFGVPTMMDMMYQTDSFKSSSLESVRYAIVGGEPMPVNLIEVWQDKGVPVRQGYGLTEFGPNVFSLNEEDSIRKIGSIGFPNFYIETRVVDDNHNDVPQGEPGELILRGPVRMKEYWKNPEETEKTVVDGWVHTGDIVRVDEEGYFYEIDRKKEMFISGAENVYPAEVEHTFRKHPAVWDIAVIGVPDKKWGESGKAFIVLEKGESVTPEELMEWGYNNLAKYKVPKHYEFLDELPKSDSGKILKRKLRDAEES
jgi:fatty-acyl-CoA synthase